MTIDKFTFFSPDGNNFPVTANADGKLYMMLSGFDYTSFGREDWEEAKMAGLTRTYMNTSIVMAGRYFELKDELVNLQASAKNYIHIAIDLSTPLEPVTITVATADQSNTVDINNTSGVYKRCIEIAETDGGGVVKVTPVAPTHVFKHANIDDLKANKTKTNTLDVSGAVNFAEGFTSAKKGIIQSLEVKGATITQTLGVTKTVDIGQTLTAQNITSRNGVSTKKLIVDGIPSERSNSFRTPTIYSTINGTALQEFLLYRNGNVVTGNFADIRVDGGIPAGGAIIGWIQDNAFKPEYTHKFTMYTLTGKRMMLSVDPGGAFRNWGDAIPKGDEIYGGVFWICKGTEGGIRGK
nr:MAG TPA: receptor binding protein [Caudoviricetes sp.]